jgi:glycosyltransferase involved in cell wall biosynthesis/peptidoglycan/xylan/chitin deacetylase (PgdA/CDA1 family)
VNSSSLLRFSVVIPTYQRRDVVLGSVRALAHQSFSDGFEVIVVVDGSTDGSADALRALETPFPLIVLEHPNKGLSVTRNRGASAARGEILLFLDDDMEAHPDLLREHDRSHREGADVVIGHIPLHPESPANFLSRGAGEWAEDRARTLSALGATLTLHDLLAGQLSIPAQLFRTLGGFDTDFTRGGTFGNEDVDFGHRLLKGGHRLVFNPRAISWQKYVVQPGHYLRQWRQAGRADVLFARKHPDQAETLLKLNWKPWIHHGIWRLLLRYPISAAPLVACARAVVLRLVAWRPTARVERWFRRVQDMEYWRGVQEAGGIPGCSPVRVLAYHAVTDLSGTQVMEPYGVLPAVFERQLDTLVKAGFHFIHPDEFACFLQGRGTLPRRAVLLTFDDCYEDLLHTVLPILRERNIPAIAFAVTGHVGGTNAWDAGIGSTQLRLLDADGLRQLARSGVEIGAHSRTHRYLTQVPENELQQEVAGSVADLEQLGLPRPRFFSYPHGLWNSRLEAASQEAGLQAAFTIDPGLYVRRLHRYRVPRIEILSSDRGWRFLWKVIRAGRGERG